MADVLALLQEGLSSVKSGNIPDASFLKALMSKVKLSVVNLTAAKFRPSNSMLSKLLDSQALGYAIVAGASLLKVPQILGILNSGSAAGLNMASVELENIGFSVHTAYGYALGLPFSAFGEAVIILLQNTLLLTIIYYYTRAPLWRGFLMILLTSCGGWFVLSGKITLQEQICLLISVYSVAYNVMCSDHAGNATEKMIMSAYELNNFIFMAAKLPQIMSNYKV